jgi:lysophospholipase L1-like esterase
MQQNVRFERMVSENESSRILILGDSSAEGVGASQPSNTIAGYFGSAYPHATIVNRGRSGARVQELASQLEPFVGQEFNLVVVLVGANDVMANSQPSGVESALRSVLQTARKVSAHVVLLMPADPGKLPAFRNSPELSRILSARTDVLFEIFHRVATETGVRFVKTFLRFTMTDAFIGSSETMISSHDSVHPTDICYLTIFFRIMAHVFWMKLQL